MREILSSIFRTIFILLILIVGIGKLGEFHWFADLFSHWQLQYGAVLLVTMIFFLILRRWFFFLFSIFVMMFLAPDLTLFLGKDAVSDVQLYFVNAHYTNSDNQKIVDSIQAYEPELISVVEISEDLATRIRDAGYVPVYEHFNEYESFAFYHDSRLDPTTITRSNVYDVFPYPIGSVKFYDTTIFTVHPFPGILKELAHNQEIHFAQLKEKVDALDGGLHMIVGDFNSSVFSQVFQKYFGEYKTRARLSWQVGSIFALPIDHALSNIDSFIYEVGEDVGSDHRPLLIEFVPSRQGLFGSGV